MIIDFFALLLLGVLLIRGWARGFVREGMDLVGLIVGTILAFRLAPLLGAVFEALFGLSEGVARLIAGTLLLFAVGIGAAFLTRAIETRFRMPGLNWVNRAGGAGLAAAWGIFLATLLLTLAAVSPLPPSMSEHLDDSAVTRTLTDPNGLPQEVFDALAGDRLVAALVNIRDLVGSRQVIIGPDDRLEIEPAKRRQLERDHGAAIEIFELLNAARVQNGLPSLEWDQDLAEVGAGHAFEMYLDGYFAHVSPITGDVGDRLVAAGISYRVAGENLALAVSTTEVHEGLMDSPGHRANILGESYTRVGIAVVDGPLGLMTVQVFTG